MALFNWFQSKSASDKRSTALGNSQKPERSAAALAAVSAQQTVVARPAPDATGLGTTTRSDGRKAKRQVRREQLYAAIRQAMTRAGVLSASYKFKVLSLDQLGDQFLVMMDVHPSLGLQDEKLVGAEALIVRAAKTQSNILVTTVYWRVDVPAEPKAIKSPGATPKRVPIADVAMSSFKETTQTPYEPINDDEVRAFKRALALPNTAAAPPAGTPRAVVANVHASIDKPTKSRGDSRSYALMTGFEDTEIPEHTALPALSATQYGDLN